MGGCHGNDWHVGRDEAHEQTSGKTGEETFSRLSELGKGNLYEPRDVEAFHVELWL